MDAVKGNKMNIKYIKAIESLNDKGTASMKVYGNSMMPIIKSGSLLTFIKCDCYYKGDIVFCKVRGRIIDAHKITKIKQGNNYMIANNSGHENGWTRTIFGKVAF